MQDHQTLKMVIVLLLKKYKMKLSIVISTYYRKDGTTAKYLKQSLDSVFNQTHQDFKIYLIGDRYEKKDEIDKIISLYDKEKLFFKNLEIAKERDFYKDKWAVWSYGGVNATNIGIDISVSEGNYYICHLDHDDYWSPNHLEIINNCIEETNSDWICTKSMYVGNRILPSINSIEKYVYFLPLPEGLIHSSVCMNFKKIPLRYRDIYQETGKIGLPADAELWQRCRMYINNNNLKSNLINQISCYHIEEGFERR
jgi:glycosyltransferase involved in cell wall biosynthesis